LAPCGIQGYRAEKKSEVFVMEELNESRLLAAEGRTMKHCVSSYAYYCEKGRAAIFSLRKYSDGILLDIMATIEVSLQTLRVVQAKAKMNRPISEEARKHLEAWAKKEGLIHDRFLLLMEVAFLEMKMAGNQIDLKLMQKIIDKGPIDQDKLLYKLKITGEYEWLRNRIFYLNNGSYSPTIYSYKPLITNTLNNKIWH